MLRHTAQFHSPLTPVAARASLVAWMQAIGYRPTSPPFLSTITFERGSWVGNVGKLAPNSWIAKLRAEFEAVEVGCEVTMEWSVSTFGQVGTKADVEFWRTEARMTIAAACGLAPDPREHLIAATKAQNGDLWRALVFTASALVPPLFFGIYMQSAPLALVALVVGSAAGWLALRAPRDLGDVRPPVSPPPPPSV